MTHFSRPLSFALDNNKLHECRIGSSSRRQRENDDKLHKDVNQLDNDFIFICVSLAFSKIDIV
jgi:hypothetical protein